MKSIVYIALGSNLGDRAGNLRAAIKALEPAVCPLKCSPVYETPPWGYLDQPKFLNQVVEAETDLSPMELLGLLKEIEGHIGRKKSVRYGPRLIDLDIILYNNEVINTPPLIIPHPHFAERSFVLLPLADLNPDLLHPTNGKSISELLAKVETNGIIQVSPEGCDHLGQ
ncbi:MAG: 2-amino-4-hydroxy-6-hydroxymethyldihydropteridine diphosphokinase [Chloroflexota bacterium]|nr:MAG: 2-amino-4-hydroxy-6-hydroxymethyldihydropteridine diphosphokinase [Chloroflexota bacterium]